MQPAVQGRALPRLGSRPIALFRPPTGLQCPSSIVRCEVVRLVDLETGQMTCLTRKNGMWVRKIPCYGTEGLFERLSEMTSQVVEALGK